MSLFWHDALDDTCIVGTCHQVIFRWLDNHTRRRCHRDT